LERASFEPA